MKLYVFSDDYIDEGELNSIAHYLNFHKKKFSKKPNKITDDDIVNLALALNLSIEKFEKIMRQKHKP